MEPFPEPHEIFERTRQEGRRRLDRPLLELSATALVAGFDIVIGLVALAATEAALTPRLGTDAASFVGALAFGLSFVFVVVGRSELFTENFLVPVAGLERERRSWHKLAELWTVSPLLNVAGGVVLLLVVTSQGVLPDGGGAAFVRVGETVAGYDATTAFLSAVFAGALITLMTWLVEASWSWGVRVVVAWAAGFLLALGTFDHAIVDTLALVGAMRYGADVGVDELFSNFGLAALGNLTGGVLFVTLARAGQAAGSSRGERTAG